MPDDKKAASSNSEEASKSGSQPQGEEFDKIVQGIVLKHSEKPSEGESATPTDEGESQSESSDQEVEAGDQSTEEQTDQQGEEKVEEGKEEKVEEKQEEEKPAESQDDSKLPFNKHPRWKQVIQERNEAREALEREKPLAEYSRKLFEYCQKNNISDDDLDQALQLISLSKSNVVEFRNRIASMVDGIDFASGSRLPEDLAKAVSDGTINEQYAKEIAQARERDKVQTERAKLQQRQSQRNQQLDGQRKVESFQSALNQWENSIKAKTPDYGLIQPLLNDRINALYVQKGANSVQDIILIAEQAFKDVTATVGKFRPKQAPRKPLLSKSASMNNGKRLEMKSLNDLDAIVADVANKHGINVVP